MQFLKTLLVALFVAFAVAFSINNWTTVALYLWGGLVAEVNLPLLMGLCFLAGLLPLWLWHRAVRWRLRQRLATSERTVTDLRAVHAAAPSPAGSPPASASTSADAVPPSIIAEGQA